MTVRDWEQVLTGSLGTAASSERYSLLWDDRHDPGAPPTASSTNGIYFYNEGDESLFSPVGGEIAGTDITGFNEGVLEVYFASRVRSSNVGMAHFAIKAYGGVDGSGYKKCYRIEWGGSDTFCYLRRRNTTGTAGFTLLSTSTVRRAENTDALWGRIRIAYHWVDASTFNILVQGDSGDGLGLTTLIDYNDTSPVADDSGCTIGIGADNSSYYQMYMDTLSITDYETPTTTPIVPPPVLPPPPPPVYGSTDEALTRATVVVPVYGSLWNSTLVAAANAVIAEKVAHPSVQMIAIINPANGPGTLPLASIRNFITSAQAAGIVVLAYVSTYYMHATDSSPTRSPFTGVLYTPAKIKADIARYKEYYPTLDGIHYDELSGVSAKLPEYTDITNYARALGYSLLFANPGGAMNSLYYDLFDTFEVYEGGSYPSEATINTRAYTSDKSKFTVIVHSVGVYTEASVEAYQNHAWGIYVTHTDDYGDISDYLGDLMDTIEAL